MPKQKSDGCNQIPEAIFLSLVSTRLHANIGKVDVMSFGAAIKSFWTNYANFNGRARRSEYWFISLFLFLTNSAAAAIDLVLLEGDVDQFLANGGGGIVGLLWILATIVPALAVQIRRLHDTGKSGWWVLIGLVPFAGAVVLVIFYLLDSDLGENKFGPSPKTPQQTL